MSNDDYIVNVDVLLADKRMAMCTVLTKTHFLLLHNCLMIPLT